MAKGQKKQKQEQINKKTFEKLCSLQCTILEMCSYFDVSEETINRWCQDTYNMNFAGIFEQKRGKGKISLRRMQWQQAEKNPTMAIWLR